MSLKFILGEKKSGKTSYILEELKKNKDSFIIVPEQTLFLYEKTILEKLGEEHSFNTNIFSFKKLAEKLLSSDECYNRIKLLDNDTKSLVIEKILLSNKDKLVSFKNAVSSPGFSEKLSSQIGEFKKYLIDKETILKISKSDDINKNLKDKLKDLSFVYNEYEEKIKDIYLDFDDLIKTASDKVISEKLFLNTNIYIDSFTGFTGEELYMIKAFLHNKANVFISLSHIEGRCDNFGDLNYTVKNTKNKLIKIADSMGEQWDEIVLKDCFIKNPSIKFLSDNYTLNSNEKYQGDCENIKIIKCRNIKYECENLASMIVSHIIKSNASLNDMAVIVPDIKEYVPYLNDALSTFDISCYSNEKTSVYDMPVAMLLNNVFNIILSSNRMDVIMGYLKSGYFFKDNPDKIYKFEEFVRKTGIRAFHLLKKPFLEIIEEKKAYNFKICNEEDLIDVYNRAIYPLVKLKEKVAQKESAKDYSVLIYDFFKEINLDKTLLNYGKEYEEKGDIIKGRQLIQVYNYILESMERTTLVLSDTSVSFLEYKNIIIASLKNKNIAMIPILNESVYVTEPSNFFNDSYKYIYILGANEGKLPSLSFGEGIINEEERGVLLNLGIELFLNSELRMMENKLKVYDILTSPDEFLFISYSMYSKGGTEQLVSEFVLEISDLFSIDEEKENIFYLGKRELLKETLSSFSGKKILDNKKDVAYLLNHEEYSELIKESIEKLKNPDFNDIKVKSSSMKKLIGDSLRVSTTNMEKYNSCGFSYFIRYVLRAKENEEFSINSANLGSVLHLILEQFSSELKKDNKDFKDIDDNYIKEKLKKVIENSIKEIQNGVFASDVRGEVFKRKLWSTAYKTICLIRKHFINGSFKTVGFEVGFGKDGSEMDGIVFDVGDGRKVVLNGVIDRVDKFEKDGSEYIRIVDYKSSEKTLDFYEVVMGLKMQLAIYLMTVLGKDKIDKIKPGGMLYLSLKSPMISVSSPTEEDMVEAKIRQKLTMKGFYLNTNEIAEAMDKELKDNKKSEIVDLEIDSMGIPKNKNTLSIAEFETLLGIVRKNIETQGKNIFDGKFPIKPIKDKNITSCDYCPYSSVCMFDNENSQVVNIKKMSRDELF